MSPSFVVMINIDQKSGCSPVHPMDLLEQQARPRYSKKVPAGGLLQFVSGIGKSIPDDKRFPEIRLISQGKFRGSVEYGHSLIINPSPKAD